MIGEEKQFNFIEGDKMSREEYEDNFIVGRGDKKTSEKKNYILKERKETR